MGRSPALLPRPTPRLPPPGGEQRLLMASKLNIFGVPESVRADRGAPLLGGVLHPPELVREMMEGYE